MLSGPQSIDCCWKIHPYLFPTKEFMTVISFYLSQFVGSINLALSWVLLSILSLSVIMGVIVTFKFHVIIL